MSKQVYKELWKTIAHGDKWEGEFYNRKKDGTYYWEQACIAPVADANGETINFIKVGKEIGEQKKIQQELFQAKLKAEESDRLKSAFLANLSHEIRTPLNGIMGFTDLLVSDDTTKEAKSKYNEIIQESGEQLLMIINDLVKISKIEAGELSVKYSEFSIDQLIQETIAFFHPDCATKGITLTTNPCQCDDFNCISDRKRLRQVLDNLVKNAIKFTEKGIISLHAECSKNHLTIKVKDTGIGITRENQEIIFDRFRQIEEHYTRNFGGNGLGLSISKEIVELLGGELWVESELGEGSTFTFSVPLQDNSIVIPK